MENNPDTPARPRSSRRTWWWKVPAIIVGTLACIILLALIAMSMVLNPERLTRWTSRYGTEYLIDGRVEVGKVDLTIWSTFPHAQLSIDSLRVVNNAVPAEYGTVLSVGSLTGRVNLAALLAGTISIGHVEIHRPCATLWTGMDSTQTSLSILPQSDSDKDDSAGPLIMPDIRISSFNIYGDAVMRYVSEPDSIDAALTIRRTMLAGHEQTPEYTLAINGNMHVPAFLRVPLDFTADGGIGWKTSDPLALSLHEFRLGVDSLMTVTSMQANFADGVRIDRLSLELLPLPLQRVAELAAAMPALQGKVPEVRSTAAFALRAELQKPYVYNPDTLLMPAMTLEARVADSPLAIPQWYLNLTNFGLDLRADIADAGLDRSTVELKRMNVAFPATDFTLTAKASNLLSDPAATGCFKGRLNFSNINPRLWTLLGMRLRGAMNADFDFNTRLSYLSPERFHRARLSGQALLSDFEALMPADSIDAGLTRATLRFGSSGSFNGVDSLLMATVRVDSGWATLPELTVRVKDFALGLGASNTASSADTTTVTPMGGRLSVKSLAYRSAADSTRALVRDLSGALSLRRYKGNAKAPQIGARLEARRIVYADGVNRAALRGIDIAATGYATPRRQRSGIRRQLSAADSLRMAARRDSMLLAESKYARLDVDIDRSTVSLLRRWHLRGRLLAKSGRVMTPMFPLRTRLSDLNVTFNPDSLMLNSMKVTAGRSDLSIKGSITNIQRSLGRRRATSPLRMALELSSDTLNVNQLTQAAFRGAAFSAHADSLAQASADMASLDADDSQLEATAEAEATDEMMAIVVPMNVDATVNLSARNIIYSTMALKDFRGEILVANGAANLRDLHAATDIGSVDLNMLYYAPTRTDVNFGMGLDLKRFNIGRVTEMMPALDSIMPILNTLGGIIDVDITATTPVDSMLNIKFPELRAMVHLSGDSLRVLDEKTFKTISKWLLFRDKNKNMIDHMDVHLAIDDNQLSLYPFMFDFDRYRIGVMGNNDMNLNLDYHVSILKSPIPFKFGVNIKGTADDMKIRVGRARFKEDMAAQTTQISDTVRVNLAREIRNVFNRGANAARLAPLEVRRPKSAPAGTEAADTISASDSLYLRQQGLLN